MVKILFLVPYPIKEAPSQRFRFEQYFTVLKENQFNVAYQSFLSENKWRIFYAPGNQVLKFLVLFAGFIKRLFILFTIGQYHYLFIHREVTPVGPPVFEWIIAKVFRKKIIYDFDDAIWLTDKTNESTLEKIIRWRSKVESICKWSYKVSCGNEYLADYSRQFNSNVIVNPTTIDTENHHNPVLYEGVSHSLAQTRNDSEIIIGWTGSHSTLKYLKIIEPVLQQVEENHPYVSFLVIANQQPELALKRVHFSQWNKETEASDLLKMDIGIMPLPDDEWTKGKCGFKALQYMAMEIPCVASPVGVNTKIIIHAINGLLAGNQEDWLRCLKELINDKNMRKTLGKQARMTVLQHYSVTSNTSTFLSLFR